MPKSPGLQSRSGHLAFLGGLTLGAAVGSQLSVWFKEIRAFESIPAWLALRVAWWRVLDDGSHRDLLLGIPRLLRVMAQDGEVAHAFQPLLGRSRSFFWGLMEA